MKSYVEAIPLMWSYEIPVSHLLHTLNVKQILQFN